RAGGLRAAGAGRGAAGRGGRGGGPAGPAAGRRAPAAARLAAVLAPLRGFLAELTRSEQAFRTWLDTARERAGRFADRIPPPPPPPSIPPDLAALAHAEPQALVERLFPADDGQARLPSLPHLNPMPLPAPPPPPPP